jgi:hypothetical protein
MSAKGRGIETLGLFGKGDEGFAAVKNGVCGHRIYIDESKYIYINKVMNDSYFIYYLSVIKYLTYLSMVLFVSQ